MKNIFSGRLRLVLAMIVLIAISGLIYLGFFNQLGQLVLHMDVRSLSDYLRSFGVWAVVVSLALNVLQSVLAVVPSVFLSGANAAVFGLFWGTVISWLGEVLGAAVTFVFYRFLGREALERRLAKEPRNEFARQWMTRLQKLDRISASKGLLLVLVARLLPFMPSGLVTLLAAISGVSFWAFMLGTGLGKGPSLVLETLVGHDLLFFEENKLRLAVVLGVLILFWLGWRYRSKLLKLGRGKGQN